MTIKILIVDDDPDFRALCKRMLRKRRDQDYLLEEAADATAAVESFSKNSFDCVLVDYRLPDMSGTDLIRTLRKSSGHSIPMILLSASDRENMAEAKGLAEATSYLSKSEIGNLGLSQIIQDALDDIANHQWSIYGNHISNRGTRSCQLNQLPFMLSMTTPVTLD